jgi:diguanylate cyclase (GGDEF)-like protein
MTDHHIKPLKSIRSFIVYAGLIIAGLAGNYFKVPLYFGVDLLFGGIAALVAVRLYGTVWGTMTAAVASSYTYFLWHHPYSIIIFTFEVLVVGLLLRRKNENIILYDSIYWIFIGMPLSWLFHYYLLEMGETTVLLIVLKQGVNGAFNALLAGLIVTYLPVRRWAGGSTAREPVSMLRTLFNLLMAFVMFTGIMFMIKDGRWVKNELESDIRTELFAESGRIADDLISWHMEHMQALEELAGIAAKAAMAPSPALQHSTEVFNAALPDFIRIHIDDAAGTSIAFAPPVDEKGQPTVGLNFADRPYYKQLKTTLKPVMSDIFVGRVGLPAPVVTMGVPVISEKRFHGCVIGSLDLGYIKKLLERGTERGLMEATVIDSKGRVIASTHDDMKPMGVFDRRQKGEVIPLHNGIYQWLPQPEKNVPEALRWQKSFYVKETFISDTLPWTLVVEEAVAPYQKELQRHNIQSLSGMLAVTLAALLLAGLVSRNLARPLDSLARVTTNLPAKIVHRETVDWPGSSIREMDSLVNNFKTMAAILRQNFMELWEEKERAQDLLGQMKHQAFHDPLTGLPNRVLFNDRLIMALAHARRNKEMLAVLFFDLDQFKTVNDTLGHAAGDKLLTEVAARLAGCLREKDTIARMGGDEFTMLLPQLSNEEGAVRVARKVLDVLQRPWVINGHEFHITASIGIALYPNDGDNSETLMKHADIAMYRAKDQGRNNYQLFTPAMNDRIQERQAMENSLRHALDRGEFTVFYQPLVHTGTGRFTGMEALVRWLHPERGVVTPDQFIPVAEENGLIVPIGEWVLYSACAQNKAWQEAGWPPIRVTVNISAYQFRQHDLAETVARILKETGLEPGWLELEITESTAMKDVERTVSVLRELSAMGVQIAIDDFGTGYSSLNYLKRFPIHTLKIDRFFVRDIITSPEDAAIVTAIIVLGQNLNLKVIAEGVETEEQMIFLRERRCEEMQGYLFSRPVPAGEFEKLLPGL